MGAGPFSILEIAIFFLPPPYFLDNKSLSMLLYFHDYPAAVAVIKTAGADRLTFVSVAVIKNKRNFKK